MGSFYPPTVSEGWTDEPGFRFFTRPSPRSVIKRDGAWTTVHGLDHYEILDLTEGVDYFIGGREYTDVDSAILAELEAAGYTVVE